MGWDSMIMQLKDIPGHYHSLVLGYLIPGFLIIGYSIDLQYPIPDSSCLILRYPRDIPKTSKDSTVISLGYPAQGHISEESPRYP
jgi:hypothetical protein